MIGLIIPDAHVNQDQNLERFLPVGQMIVDIQPDFIMSIGDFLGMHALSHWDRNKRVTMEGRRYRKDIEAGNEALDSVLAPLLALQEKQRHFKERIYRPALYYIMGNHEAWAKKFVEENPAMEGFVDPCINLRLAERGFEVIDYKEYLELNGILFTHCPLKGGVPVQGQYAMQRAFEVTSKAMIFGHLHRFEYIHGRRLREDKIPVMSVGCFFEEEYEEDFLKGCPNPYWRGIVLIDSYKPGQFDATQISLEKLQNGLL
jgi:UDP-2,3-diacylglucosamine pyrophosphatase LpxH